MQPLLPIRHPNRDFFVCDIFDALPYFKDDRSSMEHPVFSLSTKPDQRTLHYEHNGNSITISPGSYGLATIHDKDILLYCASYLRAAIHEGYTPSQRIRVTAYDLLVSTNRGTDGPSYNRLKNALRRLSGTRIETNIATGDIRQINNFGIIDGWNIVEKSPVNDRMIAIEIKLSDWFYNAIISNELLTIHRDYFRIRKPIERRVYELARKHCGDEPDFKISLSKLHKKIGTTAPIRKIRASIREIEKTDHLPDYSVSMADDVVAFKNRAAQKPAPARQGCLPLLLTDTYEDARTAAPGWDVYALEREWREWTAGKSAPAHPDRAFLAFCRRKHRQHGRP